MMVYRVEYFQVYLQLSESILFRLVCQGELKTVLSEAYSGNYSDEKTHEIAHSFLLLSLIYNSVFVKFIMHRDPPSCPFKTKIHSNIFVLPD